VELYIYLPFKDVNRDNLYLILVGCIGSSSVTFSDVFRYINGITSSAHADIFKNFAFYPHSVCVCFFPTSFANKKLSLP
jgi:hypothetical protein